FYKSFGFPVIKVFLGALFTYQLIYWSWLKLESLEVKEENDGGYAAYSSRRSDTDWLTTSKGR
ncbi:hypothetical protein EJ08DRAFT_643913, partial [Tothia fuscella]